MTDVLAVVGIGGSGLLVGLCVVACPVIMGAMMWKMNRGMSSPQQPSSAPMVDPAKQAELARLRAEIDQLKAGDADTGERPASQHR
ncbi:MAG: hypothetical protein M0Z42_08050 [Actinomycetota bacterium]|jgi:hypothetical protein|nr:hypothetical protein [Actinomycetota bacterium]